MIERVGGERLLEMLLVGTPDRVIDAASSVCPEDAADVLTLRGNLALLGSAARPGVPSPGLRARILASKPRPRRPKKPVVVVCDMLNDHLTPGCPLEVPRARDIVPALKERLKESRAQSIPVI